MCFGHAPFTGWHNPRRRGATPTIGARWEHRRLEYDRARGSPVELGIESLDGIDGVEDPAHLSRESVEGNDHQPRRRCRPWPRRCPSRPKPRPDGGRMQALP